MNKMKEWSKAFAISTTMMISGSLMAQDGLNSTVDLEDAIAQVQEVSTTTLADGRVILTDQDGLSLYLFDVDQPGVSNCFGQCLVVWPALATEETSLPEPFSIHTRDDGTQQIVFEDSPLYYFISDQKEGDILGDGVNGVWHLIEINE